MIDSKIITFIGEHHVLNLATCKDSVPYCANCFYAFDAENFRFIIASDTKTNHIRFALQNPYIAGTIYLETKEVGKIQGLQFTGQLKSPTAEEKKLYFKTYPFALAMMPKLWSLHIEYIKFTDNRLGFGGKIEHKFS
jgi:uncharacterized protein YhbP (UPF0306 family)